MAADALDRSSIANILLVRLGCGSGAGCTAAQIQKDLNIFVSHRLLAGEWRSLLNSIIDELTVAKFVKAVRFKQKLTSKGQKHLKSQFDMDDVSSMNWSDVQSTVLIAVALGIANPSDKVLKSLKSADGLKAGILKSKLGLQFRHEVPSVTQLRTSLALKAIEKGFGDDVSGRFSANMRLPEKLGIFLASRLLERPRNVSSTPQLLSMLAAELAGSVQTDPKSLRLAVMREYVMSNSHQNRSGDHLDLAGFAKTVSDFARNRATGWPGNKRAYISHVWQTLQEQGSDWGLDENEFKNRLTEAHRKGHLSLAIADLRDKKNIGDVQASVTKYKNSEWHLIRIED